MKLQELVKFRNHLNDMMHTLSLKEAVNEKVKFIELIQNTHNLPTYDSYIASIISSYSDLLLKNDDILADISNTITQIETNINQLGCEIEQTTQYRERFTEDDCGQYLPTSESVEQVILSKISRYSDWRFPGLQLQCRYHANPEDGYAVAKYRINNMVANDPLYLAGTNQDLLKNMILEYPEVYQKRVRVYEVHDGDTSRLPQRQFNFVLCWDFFNYQPLDKIELYLTNIMRLLRPGGVLMFSYNNCDLETSARFVDEQDACWANTRIIKELTTRLGYELLEFTDLALGDDRSSWASWAEVRRPGELTTVKRSQAVGRIGQK